MKRAILALLMLMMLVFSVQAVPLSIIDKDLVDFDPDIQDKAWVVILRGDNSADYLLFAEGEDLADTDDGVEVVAKNGFTLESSIQEETCKYSLSNNPDRRDIYEYKIYVEKENAWFWEIDDFKANCEARTDALLAYGLFAGFFTDIYCLRSSKVATAGDVGEGRMDFRAKFTLSSDDGYSSIKEVTSLGATKSPDITNQITSQAVFTQGGDRIAKVKWIGSSFTGELCPGQDNFYAIQEGNNWYTGSLSLYTLYQVADADLNDIIDTVNNQGTFNIYSVSDLQSAINTANARANDALSQRDITFGSTAATYSGAESVLQLPRTHFLISPDFEVKVRADWLQLVYLVGKPNIIDAKFTTCIEGSQQNNIQVTIENEGNTRGKFDTSLFCDQGLGISSTASSITLEPDESATLEYPFSLSISEDNIVSCDFVVADSNDPSNKDTMTFSESCTAERFCPTEGEVKCVGQVEFICSKGYWEETGSNACIGSDECNRNAICEPDLGESFEICGGKASSNNDCATCNADGVCDATETIYTCPLDCGVNPPKDLTAVFIVGGIVLAVAVYFLTQKAGKKKRRVTKK